MSFTLSEELGPNPVLVYIEELEIEYCNTREERKQRFINVSITNLMNQTKMGKNNCGTNSFAYIVQKLYCSV
ncbi:hypothetical protein JW930_00355 [Candidatus Woesearchaeota archaeon]|nr:hypothetical protein [Candidatus Woesearchaeota archaeon]